MKLSTQQAARYKGKFINFLKKQSLHKGHISIFRDEVSLNELRDEILKHSEIALLLARHEIAWALEDCAVNFLKDHRPDALTAIGPLIDFLSHSEVEVIADEFIQFLINLPYQHVFLFPLPIKLPEKVSEISLSQNASIVRGEDKEKVFFAKKIEGYGEQARIEALASFKRFMLLAEIEKFMPSYTFLGTRPEPYQKASFIASVPVRTGSNPFNLPYQLAVYIADLSLVTKPFEGYVASSPSSTSPRLSSITETQEEFFIRRFQEASRLFNWLERKDVSEVDYIHSAIEWAFEGLINENETMGFIQECIALEALLGDKAKNDKVSLTETLSDRAAYLIGKTNKERAECKMEFKEIYQLRSKLIHGVYPTIRQEHQETVSGARRLLFLLIKHEILLNMQAEGG